MDGGELVCRLAGGLIAAWLSAAAILSGPISEADPVDIYAYPLIVRIPGNLFFYGGHAAPASLRQDHGLPCIARTAGAGILTALVYLALAPTIGAATLAVFLPLALVSWRACLALRSKTLSAIPWVAEFGADAGGPPEGPTSVPVFLPPVRRYGDGLLCSCEYADRYATLSWRGRFTLAHAPDCARFTAQSDDCICDAAELPAQTGWRRHLDFRRPLCHLSGH